MNFGISKLLLRYAILTNFGLFFGFFYSLNAKLTGSKSGVVRRAKMRAAHARRTA
jgi:hypothetical protein